MSIMHDLYRKPPENTDPSARRTFFASTLHRFTVAGVKNLQCALPGSDFQGMQRSLRRKSLDIAALLVLLFLIGGCGGPAVRHPQPVAKPPAERKAVARLGFTIQAGAFAQVENAARLTRTLQEKGLDATYFAASKGLYKVRFGNFPARETARARAEEMRAAGIIEEFYIVSPEEYALARRAEKGENYLREELVRTARSFLGVPYLWGGASAETGFDCSGLAMTVYQLNGFDLPRTSRDQFGVGSPVERSRLELGDLLFFAPEGDKVSHVGIYAGNGQFIHASGKGKQIRTDSLSAAYFSRTYLGARSYL
jgi:cell wall-associated NlpC family hydrolase